MTVLVTGFGPFDGGTNASEALVRALPARLPAHLRAQAETLILPVDTDRAGPLLAGAVARIRPSALLLCGQAAGRNRISLEARAINRRDFRTPDAAGRVCSDEKVLEQGPDDCLATWPDLEGAVAALNAAGIPAQVSQDCGTHLCNQILYLALHAAQEQGLNYSAVFLHVPLLPEQVIAGEPAAQRIVNCPYMPLEMSLRAVEIVLARRAVLGAAA